VNKSFFSPNTNAFLAPAHGALALAQESIDSLIQHREAEERAERLEQCLERREKQFQLICHDIRSPLAIVKMCADLIQYQTQPSDSLGAISLRIATAIGRANKMLEEFLATKGTPSAAEPRLRPVICDLTLVATQTIEELSVVYKDRFVLITKGQAVGHWDAAVLRRALENLLTNGVKYGTEDAVVSVKLEGDLTHVHLSVHNFGAPIAPEDMAKLFQWRKRGPGALSSGKPGWGMGLTLVQAAAEAHGGRVEVSSTPETGTTFTLRLPKTGAPAQTLRSPSHL
jgi:signal transduction histidine kinase